MRLVPPLLLLTSTLAACSTVSLNPAPVVSGTFTPIDGSSTWNSGSPGGPAPAASSVQGPNAPFAGRPGYYTVQPGDTLRHIALQYGQDWHDIMRWNNLSNANVIAVGQVLRVAPPGANASVPPAARASAATNADSVAQAYPLASAPLPPAAKASAPIVPSLPAVTTSSAKPQVVAEKDGLKWSWPTRGKIVKSYNGTTSKGIDIAGDKGAPVWAAAAGKVVYAGNELRGFGNLVIIKHNSDYISVYAHNERLLVKDGEDVKRGQQIALMGSTDAPRVELHLEVRLRGKPIDPMQVLPAR